LPSPVLLAKIYFFSADPNHPYNSRHPVPVEGRWPSSRTLGRVAVDAAALGAWSCWQGGLRFVSEHNVRTTGAEAYGKAVWFWHPLLVSSRRRNVDPTGFRQSFNPPATEAKGIRLRGELGISRQTTAQGMPGCSGCTCMLVCALPCAHCTRDRGCSKHPAFPAPSSSGRMNLQTSGAMRRENAEPHSVVITRLVRNCALGRVIQYPRGSSD
jgi:hypothetical protein